MWLVVLPLDVPTLTTSRLPKRSWQSEVELCRNLILDDPTFTTSRLPRDPSSQRWNYVGEKWPMNFSWNDRLPRSMQEYFTCRKSTTWDRRLYFLSEGRRAEDFFALKNPTASAGFEPANLGTKGHSIYLSVCAIIYQWSRNFTFLYFRFRDVWRDVYYLISFSCASSVWYLWLDGFGGLVVSMLASGTQVYGFKPGRSRWIFRTWKSSVCLPPEGK